MVIYKIQNRVNGKAYVGQTTEERFLRRMSEHRNQNRCVAIHRALKKYGEDMFHITILEYCTEDNSDEREQHWISTLDTMAPNGYNLTSGGHRYRHTDTTKEKLRYHAIRRMSDPKVRRRISEQQSGERHSQYGQKQTTERIQSRVIASQKRYVVIFPDGHEEEIVNLSNFCREHRLNIQTMTCIANGTGSAKQHQGYRARKV